MGIDPDNPEHSCHHIVFRRDFAQHPYLDKRRMNDKSNLFPLPKEEHEELHRKVDSQEESQGGILYQAAPRRKPKGKKKRSFDEWLLRGLEE